MFPPGVPVGMVARLDQGGARVEPFVELSQLGHVLVVDYGLSSGLPQPVPVAAHPAGAASRRAPTRPACAEPMDSKVSSIPTLPRVNGGLARLLPIATTVLAAVIAILPVRVPGYAALVPAFTLMAVYHWTIYRP